MTAWFIQVIILTILALGTCGTLAGFVAHDLKSGLFGERDTAPPPDSLKEAPNATR